MTDQQTDADHGPANPDLDDVEDGPDRGGRRAGDSQSVAFLRRHTQGCPFVRADINGRAKRLLAGTPVPNAAADDPAALKIEKNALAILFIPAALARMDASLAAHPGALFFHDGDRLGAIPAFEVTPHLDPQRRPARVCQVVYRSLSNLFLHLVQQQLDEITAAGGGAAARLDRYATALGAFHRHTQEAIAFTPAVHLTAGIHTALFLILRTMSGLAVLGQDRLGRPPTAAELSAGMRASTPMLLAIARCHLEQLMELEPLLGKGDDPFMTGLHGEVYTAALMAMFQLAPGAALRLELSPDVQSALPEALTSDKPRTCCPALFAAVDDGENAIVALIRMVERSYLDLAYPKEAPTPQLAHSHFTWDDHRRSPH